MQRHLLTELIRWQQKSVHLPLLLRGARQVGKTYLVEYFGKEYFDNMVSINFEEYPECISCFETLKPTEILNKIEIISRKKITPGSTLLFLDEIQACPNAIMALRYFKEQLPELHIIGAGSLLEFALREKGMKMPVGRVQYIYLKQISFREYLMISGNEKLLQFIENVKLDSDIPDSIHAEALKLVKEYMVVGGMPMVVDSYMNTHSLRQCQEYQTLILKTYSDDFSKYASSSQHKYLQKVYDKTPGLVGQQIKYVNISPDVESRFLKEAIHDLSKAGVVLPIYSTSAAGLPFLTHVQEKKFKLLFLDVGLLKRATKLDMDLALSDDLMLLDRGSMTEQFVGQELIAYQDPYEEPQLFYWARDAKGSSAEVDYLINIQSNIIPIEVKAGKTGSLKSLHLLMKLRDLKLGIRISAKKLKMHGNIISVPFYMINQLPRLIG